MKNVLKTADEGGYQKHEKCLRYVVLVGLTSSTTSPVQV